MIRDAIIEEVRAIRDQVAKEAGYDVHELFRAFRRDEATSSTRHVSHIAASAEPAVAQPGAAPIG
jgi:hypothetical protein